MLILFFPVLCSFLVILIGANCRDVFYALNDLLNDAVSSLEYVALNGMMISEYSVVKGVQGCGSGLV
jgi:hypothetical protein